MILKVSRARPLSRDKCKVVVPALILQYFTAVKNIIFR